MPQEKVLADFHEGMDALSAVDKISPAGCLLAENCRLDETGNVAVSGALTAQNTSTYSDTSHNTNIHSLCWQPAIGGVAGVGKDVLTGLSLSSLTAAQIGTNTGQQKMSFASAPGKIYFDVGSAGYWSDMVNLLPVDWAPPSAGAAGGGFTDAAGNFSAGTSSNYGFAVSTATPLNGFSSTIVLIDSITNGNPKFGGTATFQVTAKMMVGGVAVGTSTTQGIVEEWPPGLGTSTLHNTYTFSFGNANTFWGYPTLTPAQVNASNFGVIYTTAITRQGVGGFSGAISAPFATVYQQATGFVAGTGTTGTLTGTYNYIITFGATNGEESDASNPSSSLVFSGNQGTITGLNIGDGRTTARNIYRKGGALTTYYLVGTVPDNTSTTFADNMTDILALAGGTILAGQVPGDFPNTRLGNQTVRFPAYHYDRVFWIVAGTNEIIWSKPLNGYAYPVINFADVGDSAPISRIISIFGELIIIKTNDQIWRLTGTDETSFNLSQTPSNQGTDMPFTVVALPDHIMFANRKGLWMFNGYTSVPATAKLDLWFKQQDRSGISLFGINGFHPPEVFATTVLRNFDACGNAEKYVLSYTEAGGTTNNAALVFDLKHGNLTKRPTSALSLACDPVSGFVYMGDPSGFISLLDDWNGASVTNMDFQTGYQNFARGSNQAFFALEFFINTGGQSIIPYAYYDSGQGVEQLAPISTTNFQRVVRTLQAALSRKAQNISVRINGQGITANVNGTPLKILNSIKVYYDVRTGRARTGQ